MIQEKHTYDDYGTDYPNSRKVYIPGSRPDIRVPMREIRLSETRKADGTVEENPELLVYDTSGPMTDPNFELNLEKGLPRLREPWIDERGDTETCEARGYQPGDDGQGQDAARIPFAGAQKTVRRARPGANVSQMHYARKGIITPEMIEVVGGVKSILFGDEGSQPLVAGPPPGSIEQAYRSPLEQ